MTQSGGGGGGGAENTFFSVTLYNFQKSSGRAMQMIAPNGEQQLENNIIII